MDTSIDVSLLKERAAASVILEPILCAAYISIQGNTLQQIRICAQYMESMYAKIAKQLDMRKFDIKSFGVSATEPNLSGEDTREGVTAVISVKLKDPQFEGQTKNKLGNPEARTQVETVLGEALQIFLEDNPIEGTIAIGSFNKGISTNQGRVGLSQK